MPIFFASKENIDLNNNKIHLDIETSNHISRVLRHKLGDIIEISDGNLTNYTCKITTIDTPNISLDIISSKNSSSEFPFEVNLYQGIAKGEKMDSIIQKAIELGVSNITPVETKFTVVKLNGDDKVSKKIDRWNKISKEAAKQCERGMIPTVSFPKKFKDALKESLENDGISFICYGREDNYNLKQFFKDNNISKDNLNSVKKISFFIGPEGGFDKEEIELASNMGIQSVSLGNRILRTETASGCVLSMIQYMLF